jgi:hypothetical protein
MTLTFHLFQDGIEVEPAPISRDEIERYKFESQRSLADRKQRIRDAIHRTYEAMRAAKPVRLIHLFFALTGATLLASHGVYA